MSMLRFLFWRLLQCVIVLWAVYTVTFALLMLAPGDPFVGEKRANPSVTKALADKYGLSYLALSPEDRAKQTSLDKAGQIGKAYVLYLGRAVRGDFGPTIQYENWTVTEVIRSSLPVSVSLGCLALLLALLGGVTAGMIGGTHKGRWPDVVLTIITLFGISLPTFVIGALLLMLFVVFLPIFPSGGWGRPIQMVLPAVTLALFYLAYIARLVRSSTLDVLSSDFVRTARAKGLSPRAVFIHHLGANAGLPVLSYLGPAAANILVGSFVVEKIFDIPGLGSHFVNACLNHDIPLVLGTVMVFTAAIVAFSLVIDIAYAWVDPRISLR
jgi:oligopeptide transport system permease protein